MLEYKLSKNVGTKNVTKNKNQYVFGYPCQDNQYDCSPYTVYLKPGSYLFETWGSRGDFQNWSENPSIPGFGGYTSGMLTIENPLIVYLYIGSISFFNSILEYTGKLYLFGGGSSDVRLYANESFDWYNPLSLRSRIMVSGGGGSAEWQGSAGGHAGGLIGGTGQSDCSIAGYSCSESRSGGGTQISGGSAAPTVVSPTNKLLTGYPGLFGMSQLDYSSNDMGGIGGNGYYSGASVNYTGSGGGGSSFISGYEGCIALNSSIDETPSPTNSPIHYSGIFFTNPIMIEGNKNMPLYYSPTSRGIGNKGRGAIRITILLSKACSCYNYCLYSQFRYILYLGFIDCL